MIILTYTVEENFPHFYALALSKSSKYGYYFLNISTVLHADPRRKDFN